MNLFFRLIYTYLFSRFRSRVGVMDECRTPYRVWPTDCDVLRHVNNGVYFSMQDLARIDYMIRIGAAQKISAAGWYPVVVGEKMRFKKSLAPFQKFEIGTRLMAWDEKYIYLEHRFYRGSEVMAWGCIRARFIKKTGGLVTPAEMIQLLGITVPAPTPPDYLAAWIQSENLHEKII
jgi:acyl-CoA thioesterase FadM